MNSFKNVLITVSVVLLIVSAAEAKKKSKEKAPPAPAAETKAPAAEPAPVIKETAASESDTATAVTVNGAKITEGQIAKILNIQMEQLAGRIPPNMKEQYAQQMRKRIMEQLIIEEMLAQKEREKNISVSPSELEEQIGKHLTQQNLTVDEFKSLLKAYGKTYSDYEQDMLKKLMFEKLMEGEFANKIAQPTDEQIKAYYNENAGMFSEPEKVHTKHILIMPAKDSNDPNQAKAQAKAKAEELLKQLKAGADFNDLAVNNSQCSSAQNGGDLGKAPKGAFVPEFEKAAYALKTPGQISDVVETEYGYHIIKLIEHIDANTTSLEDAKAQIIETLTDEKKREVAINYIKQIKAEADIQFANPADSLEMGGPKPTAPSRTETGDKNEPKSEK
jgi:peptidyl-prolyl cis-trans isomerase C